MSKTTSMTKSTTKGRGRDEAPRADIYERVTTSIVASLEAGTRPWVKPWSMPKDGRRPLTTLRATGEAYRGINSRPCKTATTRMNTRSAG